MDSFNQKSSVSTEMRKQNGNDGKVSEKSHLLSKDSGEVSTTKSRTPSTGRKIAVMTSCIAMQLMCGGIGSGLSVMYAELIQVFDAKRANAALVQSLFMGINTGGGIVFSGLISRFGPGSCSIVGVLVASFGVLVSSFAPNLTVVIIFVGVVASCGTSILYICSFITIGLIFHENASLPLVILTLGSSIGSFTMPYIFEVCIAEYQWSGAFMIVSGVILNCAIGGIIMYYSSRYYVTGNDKKGNDVKRRLCDISLLKDFVMVLILINFFLFSFTGFFEILFLVDIMTSRGYPREDGSLLITYIGFANFAGRLIGIFIRLKSGNIPTIYHWVYILPVFAVCHGLVMSLYDYTALVCACVLYGIVYGILVSQGPTIMFEASGPELYPRAMAFMNLCYGIGNFSAGVFGGTIKDIYGDYDIAFYIAIATALYTAITSAVVAIVLRRRRLATRTQLTYHVTANGASDSSLKYSKLSSTGGDY